MEDLTSMEMKMARILLKSPVGGMGVGRGVITPR
jgi:hypothetical protein